MSRALRAFVLGALGVGLLAYVAGAALALAAQAGGGDLDVGLGPLTLVAVTRAGDARSITLGAGLALVALLGGLVNACAAAIIARRAASSSQDDNSATERDGRR